MYSPTQHQPFSALDTLSLAATALTSNSSNSNSGSNSTSNSAKSSNPGSSGSGTGGEGSNLTRPKSAAEGNETNNSNGNETADNANSNTETNGAGNNENGESQADLHHEEQMANIGALGDGQGNLEGSGAEPDRDEDGNRNLAKSEHGSDNQNQNSLDHNDNHHHHHHHDNDQDNGHHQQNEQDNEQHGNENGNEQDSQQAANLALLSKYASNKSDSSGHGNINIDGVNVNIDDSTVGGGVEGVTGVDGATGVNGVDDDDYGYTNSSGLAIHPSLAAMSTDSNIYSAPGDFGNQYASFYGQNGSNQQGGQNQQPHGGRNGQHKQGGQQGGNGINTQGNLNGVNGEDGLNLMSISNITSSPNTRNMNNGNTNSNINNNSGNGRNLNVRTTLPPLQSINLAAAAMTGGAELSPSQGHNNHGHNGHNYHNNHNGHNSHNQILSPDSLPPVSSLNQYNDGTNNGGNSTYLHNGGNLVDVNSFDSFGASPGSHSGLINANGKRVHDQDEYNPNSNNSHSLNSTPTIRKKRQCAECNGWFSNLATHRSIHMANNSRPHTCDVCNRGFARPNDLFRHQKSHRDDAPFRCPLFVRGSGNGGVNGMNNGMNGLGGGNNGLNGIGIGEPACHQNGGFSRCDTYKNHLKAMHFEYPAGTKKKMRNGTAGKCKACQQAFATSDEWIATHIETGACKVVQQIKNGFGM